MSSSTTQGKLYFVSVQDPNVRLEIQFVPPKVSVARTANIEKIYAVGRNNPYHQYSSGDKTLTLDLDFFSESENREDVKAKCLWLESMTMNDGYNNPPHQVKLVFGKLFKYEVWVVEDVKYDLSLFHKEKDFLPQQAYVSVKLSLDPKSNPKASDLR